MGYRASRGGETFAGAFAPPGARKGGTSNTLLVPVCCYGWHRLAGRRRYTSRREDYPLSPRDQREAVNFWNFAKHHPACHTAAGWLAESGNRLPTGHKPPRLDRSGNIRHRQTMPRIVPPSATNRNIENTARQAQSLRNGKSG